MLQLLRFGVRFAKFNFLVLEYCRKLRHSGLSSASDCDTTNLEDFLTVDDQVETAAVLTTREIASSVCASASNNTADDGESDEDTDSEPIPPPPPSTADTRWALDTLKRFCVQNDVDSVCFDLLGQLEMNIETAAIKSRRQQTLLEFFKKT